jgi:DtxR family Mn-dependent transcriptional regulator
MSPSSTVENYLKAIYHAQQAGDHEQLVPMGQLATALGVVPGTATTMVKALADAGLVAYEPYAGVRLTGAGEKLAAMVLRRHRLLELFLVRIIGMSWADVHDEAEHLEHAVSERLIERIDEMLGHPSVDPHGDPIPDPEGGLKRQDYDSLLSCPLRTPLVITRVTDQDAAFLRFIESSNLKPGESIEIEARDPASDSVRLRAKDERRITLGMRAASKLLVEVAQVLLLGLTLVGAAHAQPAGDSPTDPSEPFAILDNSFLVEEAFNQERSIFQNIVGVVRDESGDWELALTQEWPIASQTHQFSYTFLLGGGGGEQGMGDILLNYRYQALTEKPGRPAFSPRFTVILPTGNEREGRSHGVPGIGVNLPISKQYRDVYFHANLGFTYFAGVRNPLRFVSPDSPPEEETLTTPFLAGSVIWRTSRMFHVMVESLAVFREEMDSPRGTRRSTSFTISPGVRRGWDVGEQQFVLGLAMPVTVEDEDTRTAFLGYLSYELPFEHR